MPFAYDCGCVYSIKIAEFFGIKYKKRDLIRGALLHDYFLYDWHDGEKERRILGFTHPMTALRNADRDFDLIRYRTRYYKKAYVPAYCNSADLPRRLDSMFGG